MGYVRTWTARNMCWRSGAAIALIVLATGVAALSAFRTRRAEVGEQLHKVHKHAGVSSFRVAPQADRSFVARLPRHADVDVFVQRLSKSAFANGVALTEVRVEPTREVGLSALPQVTLSIALRGKYPAMKSVLAEALGRTENATLRTLRLHPDDKAEVGAQVSLTLWLGPAAAASGAT